MWCLTKASEGDGFTVLFLFMLQRWDPVVQLWFFSILMYPHKWPGLQKSSGKPNAVCLSSMPKFTSCRFIICVIKIQCNKQLRINLKNLKNHLKHWLEMELMETVTLALQQRNTRKIFHFLIIMSVSSHLVVYGMRTMFHWDLGFPQRRAQRAKGGERC